MGGRMAQVTYAGRLYSIPEIWLAGFCRNGATILDAVEWWHYQRTLADLSDEDCLHTNIVDAECVDCGANATGGDGV